MENENEGTEKTEPRTYKIRASYLPALQEAFAKLNKRAAKLALKPLSFDLVGEELEKEVDEETGRLTGRVRRLLIVEIIGSAPVLAGWQFVARLEHTPAGNILSKAPGAFDLELPESFRTVAALCEHCKLARARIDTFVLRGESTGRLIQVGRNCLVDFIGDTNAANVVQIWKFLEGARAACEADDERESGGSWGRFDGYDVKSFLATCVAAIRELGWVSRKESEQSYEPKESTSGTVSWLLSRRSSLEGDEARRIRERCIPTDSDHAKAEKILAWVKDLAARPGKNDYQHNLAVALAGEYVTSRNVGVACSVVVAYQREVEGEIERHKHATVAPSTHFGEVGTRYDLSGLEVTFVRFVEGDYGTTTIVGYVDAEGRKFKWFASGSKDVEVGQRFSGKATVKKHDEYKGVAETYLTRCSFHKEN